MILPRSRVIACHAPCIPAFVMAKGGKGRARLSLPLPTGRQVGHSHPAVGRAFHWLLRRSLLSILPQNTPENYSVKF